MQFTEIENTIIPTCLCFQTRNRRGHFGDRRITLPASDLDGFIGCNL